ncbi:tetratricopeptide repeat protein [Polaromonas glacialis]|uniref:tetratricopeptide repeat protein n=1 Tax=Polaromonas glacialis TaxID=866564 RepID=UPI0004955B7F|nr:tetratricopeptide repeat protein [Polaromonas glacialis]
MSRNPARPVKKPISDAALPEEQAALALMHLEKGRFRNAVDCYKTLLKTEQRPEWLAGLASAYAGRAKALADKGMRREAIELWRSRAEVCHTALWEGPYAGWLVAEGRVSEVLGYLARRRTALDGKTDDGLAALEAQLAPGVLSADDTVLKQLPAGSLLLQHRPLALAALAAYARQDGPALEEALAGISFRSPYRDLRSLLKALVLWETDREAARAAIERVPPGGPFEPLAAPLRSVAASGSERLPHWARLNNSQQLMALDLMGCPRTWAGLLQALAGAKADAAPAELFDLVQRNARVLPETLATRVWRWLAPWAPRRGCDNPLIFGKPSRAQQECATALAVEIKGELGHAEEHWLDAVDMLASSKDTDDRQRAAMVLRHMATMKEHFSREGMLDKAGAGYLMRSLEFDASDCDVHVRLVAYFRRQGDLKKARERLDAALSLFPDSAALLSEAVETALAAGAFKKAATTARRLLALDPLNRKVRTLLGNAHLSHAGKHIAAGKLESAKKEIEEARSWLGAAAEQGRLHLLLAWTEPQASPERLRLAQLAVTTWGGGLAAGWRLLREAQGIFPRVDLASANWRLGEAGIDSAKALAPADVLGLVQVLEQEPFIARKGADPLVAWRKALVALASSPLFDAETSVRICEAWSRHQEHDLLEKFATAARKRWPDWPIFVYHAVAARFGKNGGIETDRDFDDLERAGELAQKNKDFKLHARIEALFEADDPGPGVDDSPSMDGPPLQMLQAFRAMLEQTIMIDGGKDFLKKARANYGDALIRQIEKECAGDKKAVLRRLIDMAVAEVAGPFGQPFQPATIINKAPPAKPIAPARGLGSLTDE